RKQSQHDDCRNYRRHVARSAQSHRPFTARARRARFYLASLPHGLGGLEWQCPQCQGACPASCRLGARGPGDPLQRRRRLFAAPAANRGHSHSIGGRSMIRNPELFDVITIAAIKGCDCDIAAHKETVWDAAVCLLADVLRESDPFTRERLLRGIEAELRESM